jgi:hypothetical protein
MLQVTTESGAIYLFEQGLGRVMRVQTDSPTTMRRDEDWIGVHGVKMTMGQSMVLLLDPLGEGSFTERTTTPVVDVVWIGDEKDKPSVRRVDCDRWGDWGVRLY